MNIQLVNIASFLKLMQDNIPYASGCLMSACQKNPEIKDNYYFRDIWWKRKEIAEYAEEFQQIDLLCLTNYMWNTHYNDVLAEAYKIANPKGIVVYGGIEIPEQRHLAKEYIDERPFIDICFVGQSEQSFQKFLTCINDDWSNIENTFGKDWNNVKRIPNLHKNIETPTPYIDGIFDNLVGRDDSPSNCVLETNRGCPYSCAFCDWGAVTRSKIKTFDIDMIYETIDWIWHPANGMQVCLMIDANFGILDRDYEILEHIIKTKEKYNNPVDLGLTGLVKNNKADYKRIIDRINNELTYSSFPHFKVGVQTHTSAALEAADRSNIKNEIMYELFEDTENQVHTELIIGLPGETPETWLDTLQKEFDMGVYYSRAYSLSVLPNAPMAKKEYLDRYKIQLKDIFIPTEFHNMDPFTSIKDPDYETNCDFTNKLSYYKEKRITECFSYSNDDLILMYQYQWWYQVFYNSRALYFEIRNSPITLKEQILCFFDNLGNMPFTKMLVDTYTSSIENILNNNYNKMYINKYRDFNYIDSSFKCDETKILFDNKETFEAEISQLYPNVDLSDWIDPYILIDGKDYYQGKGDSLRNF